jgi:glycosyltransferase involved in cell wall biosynthesis
VGGIVDAVRHQETGLLVDPGSARQVAEAVMRIQGDAGLASRLAAGARELVRTSYSRDASAARFSALFESLLEARGSDAAGPREPRNQVF